jgi:hypothetical protein
MMILACGIFYYHAEGLSFLQAAEKVRGMFLNYMLIFSISMALTFVFIGIGILIRKWKDKKTSR